MSFLIDTAQTLASGPAHVLGAGPSFDLGDGQAPPGSGGVLKGLKMLFWVICAIAVAGALGLGGKMLWSALKDGHGASHTDGMGWYLMGCMIVGSASGIPAMLM